MSSQATYDEIIWGSSDFRPSSSPRVMPPTPPYRDDMEPITEPPATNLTSPLLSIEMPISPPSSLAGMVSVADRERMRAKMERRGRTRKWNEAARGTSVEEGSVPSLLWSCTCCHRPKKFEDQESLKRHQKKRKFRCLYCRKAFKDKHGFKRHEDTRHLRREMWSCGFMTNLENAFGIENSTTGQIFVCGYCGEQFPYQPENNQQSWREHYEDIHQAHVKDCDGSRIFYRADHFRQHLSCTHSAISDSWTNYIQNACYRITENRQEDEIAKAISERRTAEAMGLCPTPSKTNTTTSYPIIVDSRRHPPTTSDTTLTPSPARIVDWKEICLAPSKR